LSNNKDKLKVALRISGYRSYIRKYANQNYQYSYNKTSQISKLQSVQSNFLHTRI